MQQATSTSSVETRDSSHEGLDQTAQARLKQMFDAHSDVIFCMLRRRGVDSAAADDLTQQAFLIAAERLHEIRPGSERAFLWETGRRLALGANRRMARMSLVDDIEVECQAC